MTGTVVNVGAVLAGTAAGTLVGARLPRGLQERVLAGLGLVTLVIGISLALELDEAGVGLQVLGAILLGGLIGEAFGIERRLESFGDRLQSAVSRGRPSRVSEGFVTASLLFCIGPLAVLGSIQDGLTGDIELLVTKSLLDGFAALALSSTLGWGVGLSAVSVLLYQGSITLLAGVFETLLQGDTLAALIATGGCLIIAISLKLLNVRDVKVGNFLPALVVAPALVELVEAVRGLS